jgi:zinc transporter 1
MSAYHVLLSVMPFKLATPAIKAGRILLEAAPVELDLDKVREDLLTVCYSSIFRTSLKAAQLPEVISIHDMHVWILSHSYVIILARRSIFTQPHRVILASLHVCVPPGTSLEQWERTEQSLQHCFAAYGVNHVTISPELYRDPASAAQTLAGDDIVICKSASHQEGLGCAVGELRSLRKRAQTDSA